MELTREELKKDLTIIIERTNDLDVPAPRDIQSN